MKFGFSQSIPALHKTPLSLDQVRIDTPYVEGRILKMTNSVQEKLYKYEEERGVIKKWDD